jgi:hypothetical protein
MGMCEITEEFVQKGKLYFEIELDEQHISMLVFRTKEDSGIRSPGKDNMIMSIPLDPEMMMRLIKIHRAMIGEARRAKSSTNHNTTQKETRNVQ